MSKIDRDIEMDFDEEEIGRVGEILESSKSGIYEITKEEYAEAVDVYFEDKRESGKGIKSNRLSNIKSIKLLFDAETHYRMFVRTTCDGKNKLLYCWSAKNLDRDIQYYYERLAEYGCELEDAVENYFERMDALENKLMILCNLVYANPSPYCVDIESEIKVSGSIIRLLNLARIYIDPFDGKIIPYFASQKYECMVFPSVKKLIAERLPELTSVFDGVIEANYATYMCERKKGYIPTVLLNDFVENNLLFLSPERFGANNKNHETNSALLSKEEAKAMYNKSALISKLKYLVTYGFIFEWDEKLPDKFSIWNDEERCF